MFICQTIFRNLFIDFSFYSCRFLTEEEDKPMCTECIRLKNSLNNILLRPRTTDEEKMKFTPYECLSRPQLIEKVRQLSHDVKLAELKRKRAVERKIVRIW